MTNAYLDMPVSQIDRNPGQPRKHFDKEALEELAASLKAHGLLEPIVVRPTGERFLIIAGERRWRASQIAGLDTVPVRVLDVDEIKAFELSVAENVNRSDMNMMEEAEAFSTLVGYGKTTAEIAAMYGKSETFVEIRLSFLSLTDEIAALVQGGKMGANLARYVARLQPGNQRIVVKKWARGEFDGEDDAAYFAMALHETEQQEGFFSMEEPTLEEREVHAKNSRKVKSALEQMDRLSALLSDLANGDPQELATALGSEAGARFDQVARIAKVAKRAELNMRKVRHAAAAREVAVREEVMA